MGLDVWETVLVNGNVLLERVTEWPAALPLPVAQDVVAITEETKLTVRERVFHPEQQPLVRLRYHSARLDRRILTDAGFTPVDEERVIGKPKYGPPGDGVEPRPLPAT